MIEDPLAALRSLHAPSPVSWWPPAPGWWIAGVLAVIFIVLIYRYKKRILPQRAALHELKLLKKDMDNIAQPVATVNQLLKRYALACWPENEVASLTGESWLAFLDANGGNGKFSTGPGQLLLTDSYNNERADSAALNELIVLVNQWIKINTPQKKTDV
ncbi:MAG: DUF4381 domain-containing protein [Burkholderiales bacterium]|nr:DUF4381 domain-containing protein [Burkholderiales bacterium]